MDDATIATTLYITILSLIICAGSTFSIFFYKQQKPMTNSGIFIITLAVIDIFFAILVAPQYLLRGPFAWYFKRRGSLYYFELIFGGTVEFVVLSYLFILTAMALDRTNAVWRPYRYVTR